MWYAAGMFNTIEHRSAETAAQSTSRGALVTRLKAHADEIRDQGVISLAIFGSRARGDARSDSDLDVLISYDADSRPFTLYDLVRVERLLERITGLDVHVSTRDGFSPTRLKRVLKDAVSVL
jgi:predicted nucleotidyltransferase